MMLRHRDTFRITMMTSSKNETLETFSVLLALCAGNQAVTGEVPSPRPVTRSFDVFFDLRLNKRFSKQSWGWWLETPSRYYDVTAMLAFFMRGSNRDRWISNTYTWCLLWCQLKCTIEQTSWFWFGRLWLSRGITETTFPPWRLVPIHLDL